MDLSKSISRSFSSLRSFLETYSVTPSTPTRHKDPVLGGIGHNDEDYEDDSDEDDCYFTRSSTTSHEGGDSYDASYQQRTATTIGDEGSLQTFPELQIHQQHLASQHNQVTSNHHDDGEVEIATNPSIVERYTSRLFMADVVKKPRPDTCNDHGIVSPSRRYKTENSNHLENQRRQQQEQHPIISSSSLRSHHNHPMDNMRLMSNNPSSSWNISSIWQNDDEEENNNHPHSYNEFQYHMETIQPISSSSTTRINNSIALQTRIELLRSTSSNLSIPKSLSKSSHASRRIPNELPHPKHHHNNYTKYVSKNLSTVSSSAIHYPSHFAVKSVAATSTNLHSLNNNNKKLSNHQQSSICQSESNDSKSFFTDLKSLGSYLRRTNTNQITKNKDNDGTVQQSWADVNSFDEMNSYSNNNRRTKNNFFTGNNSILSDSSSDEDDDDEEEVDEDDTDEDSDIEAKHSIDRIDSTLSFSIPFGLSFPFSMRRSTSYDDVLISPTSMSYDVRVIDEENITHIGDGNCDKVDYDDHITEVSAIRNAISIVESQLNDSSNNNNKGMTISSNKKPIQYTSDGKIFIPMKRRNKKWNKKIIRKEDIVHLNWFGHSRLWTTIAIAFVWIGALFAFMSRRSTDFVHLQVPLTVSSIYEDINEVGMIWINLCYNETEVHDDFYTGCTRIRLSADHINDRRFEVSRSFLSLSVLIGTFLAITLSTSIFWESINLKPVGIGLLIAYFMQSFALLFFNTELCTENGCKMGSGGIYCVVASFSWLASCVATAKMDSCKIRLIRSRRREKRRLARIAKRESLIREKLLLEEMTKRTDVSTSSNDSGSDKAQHNSPPNKGSMNKKVLHKQSSTATTTKTSDSSFVFEEKVYLDGIEIVM